VDLCFCLQVNGTFSCPIRDGSKVLPFIEGILSYMVDPMPGHCNGKSVPSFEHGRSLGSRLPLNPISPNRTVCCRLFQQVLLSLHLYSPIFTVTYSQSLLIPSIPQSSLIAFACLVVSYPGFPSPPCTITFPIFLSLLVRKSSQ